MPRYHISGDGIPRVCTAQSSESCTARGVDGASAPHGDFADPNEARRFAESVLESSSLGSGLSGVRKPWDHPDYAEFNSLIGIVADRTAFSTDMTDSSEYRVEEGKLKAVFEGEIYSLGELRGVSPEEINSWSQASFGEDAKFQDGEVFPVYDEDGDAAGAFARFGDKFYRAGTVNSFYQS